MMTILSHCLAVIDHGKKTKRRPTIIAGLIVNGLTDCYRGAMLLLSPSLAARDWRSVTSRRIAAIIAVFLCVKMSKHFTMSGWAGRCKAGRFLEACTPTCSVRLHDWRHVVGNPLFQGIPS